MSSSLLAIAYFLNASIGCARPDAVCGMNGKETITDGEYQMLVLTFVNRGEIVTLKSSCRTTYLTLRPCCPQMT